MRSRRRRLDTEKVSHEMRTLIFLFRLLGFSIEFALLGCFSGDASFALFFGLEAAQCEPKTPILKGGTPRGLTSTLGNLAFFFPGELDPTEATSSAAIGAGEEAAARGFSSTSAISTSSAVLRSTPSRCSTSSSENVCAN